MVASTIWLWCSANTKPLIQVPEWLNFVFFPPRFLTHRLSLNVLPAAFFSTES